MLPRKVKALALSWGEAAAVDTQFYSAAATRDLQSDKQVKNSLKNRDKNIPTHVEVWHQRHKHNPVYSSAWPGLKKLLHLVGRMKQKLRKNGCVCQMCPVEISWISPLPFSAQQ